MFEMHQSETLNGISGAFMYYVMNDDTVDCDLIYILWRINCSWFFSYVPL